jgi:hypothetical protein
MPDGDPIIGEPNTATRSRSAGTASTVSKGGCSWAPWTTTARRSTSPSVAASAVALAS